jgi:hypothetical protein
MFSLERALPDFGIGRIDDLTNGNDLRILLPVLVIDFVGGLSRGIQRGTLTG